MVEYGLALEADTAEYFSVFSHWNLFSKFNKDRNISESWNKI